MNRNHLWWSAGLVMVGAALYASGAVGGAALLLLWPLACMAMMAAMMWGMSRRP